MFQLVQKMSTTIPEVKQTYFASTQQTVYKDLEEGAYNNQECQHSETDSYVMCDNSNIDQITSQNFMYHKIFSMK